MSSGLSCCNRDVSLHICFGNVPQVHRLSHLECCVRRCWGNMAKVETLAHESGERVFLHHQVPPTQPHHTAVWHGLLTASVCTCMWMCTCMWKPKVCRISCSPGCSPLPEFWDGKHMPPSCFKHELELRSSSLHSDRHFSD